ncbi:MAG: hypothetical protein U0X40_06070 [Ferruginibacter sp.]
MFVTPNQFFIHNRRWLTGCLLLFWLTACQQRPSYQNWVVTREDSVAAVQRAERSFSQLSSIQSQVKSGDLITRTGSDFTSDGLRGLNQRDQTYSHCGIASLENDSLFVYHSLGGEWNPDQRIRRDPFAVFANPNSNRGIGIFRFPLTVAEQETLMGTVQSFYQAGIMFDMKFDLASNDHMYCAEFVYKSYLLGTHGRLAFTISHIGRFAFVGVDDLFLEPSCRLQQKLVYK